MNTAKQNTFFLYCRKSQESDERQVQSLEDQQNTMRTIAASCGYHIVDIISESMSAKEPGRVQFNSMVKRIAKGEAQGIIAWKLDRLTRNPVDTGTIQFMLQNGKLSTIHTIDTIYTRENSGLMFSVISGMANQFLIDLSRNVKRGMDSKVSKGWFSAKAPEGYLNNLADHTIELDREKAKLVRKIFDMILGGNYSVLQVLHIANEEWGYRTKKYKNSGGRKLQRSSLYKMLGNIFYTGSFEWKGKVYPGNHEAIITHAEYLRVQEVVSKRTRTSRYKKEFTYSALMTCPDCGCAITSESRVKHYATTGNTAVYNYYKCTKRKAVRGIPCNNKPISEVQLEEQVKDILKTIDVHPAFKAWGIDIVNRRNKDKLEFIEDKKRSLEKVLSETESKLTRLTDLLLENRISESDYDMRKKAFEVEMKKYEEELGKIDSSMSNTFENVSSVLDFSNKVLIAYSNGDMKTKKMIFRHLGSDHQMYRSRVSIELYPWFKGLAEMNAENRTNISKFGPLKKGTSIRDTNAFQSNCLKWQAH